MSKYGKKDVIIVDDDQDVVEVLSELLRLNNYNVVGTGNNGKEAAELYKKFFPDLILLDLKMPVYDGFYAISHIRRMDPNASIIIVTGATEFVSKLMTEEFKPDAIIEKPASFQKLLQTVNQVLKSKVVKNESSR